MKREGARGLGGGKGREVKGSSIHEGRTNKVCKCGGKVTLNHTGEGKVKEGREGVMWWLLYKDFAFIFPPPPPPSPPPLLPFPFPLPPPSLPFGVPALINLSCFLHYIFHPS